MQRYTIEVGKHYLLNLSEAVNVMQWMSLLGALSAKHNCVCIDSISSDNT